MNIPRWYVINKNGQVYLAGSRIVAAEHVVLFDASYPKSAPHRAAQLVDAAELEAAQKRIAELELLNLSFAQNEQQLAALKSATKLLIRMFFVDLEACDPEKETEERFMQLTGQ